MDKVSIIVPVYNAEKYIERCVKSILEQTYSNIEVLLVDDGSVDKSCMIIKRYAERDSRIRFFIQGKNKGVSCARNRALDEATGKWICFCDADDWYEKTFVEEMLQCAQKENADYIICNYKIVSNRHSSVNVNSTSSLVSGSDKRLVIAFGPLSSSIHMISNKLFKETKLRYPEQCRQYEELPVIIPLVKYAARIGIVKEPLYNYYQRGDGSSASNLSLDSEKNFMMAWNLLKHEIAVGYEEELRFHAIYALLYGEILNLSKKNVKKTIIKQQIFSYEQYIPRWYTNIYIREMGIGKRLFLWAVHYKLISVIRLLSWLHGKIVN